MTAMLLSFLLLCSVLPCGFGSAPTLKLGNTTLKGRDVTGLKQDFFGGIPFAEPPLGPLRLRPPVLKTTLKEDVFDASNFGFTCPQTGLNLSIVSEDCLTVNVFRPSGIGSGADLPVMFWTYGGSFESGSALLYNGSAIVAQSVARGTPLIYVNFNYRLGPLGFPQGQEAADRHILNLALMDQIAALEWVQENIRLFGGDPAKVTTFGQSAGAIMTAIHFLHPRFCRFSRAAIFESGSAASSVPFPAQRGNVSWQHFVAAVPSCASLANSLDTIPCLQRANSSEIVSALLFVAANSTGSPLSWTPALDGPGGVLPEVPSKFFADKDFARLPFISGTNQDEGTIFTEPINANFTTDLIKSVLSAGFSPPIVPSSELSAAIDKLLELYPDDPADGSPFDTGDQTFGLSPGFKRAAALVGDLSFDSQRRLWLDVAAEVGVKTFAYHFTQSQLNFVPAFEGVAHGSEIKYLYNDLTNATASDHFLSSIMIDYWVSFATSLNPNDGHGLQRPLWEQFTPTRQVAMQLNGDNLTLIPDTYRKEQIDFINSNPLVFRH